MRRHGYDGIGFMFSHSPYCGIDIDAQCDPAYAAQLQTWANSYTEVSPSGQGKHIIVQGRVPTGLHSKYGVEMYSEGRYFTVTGDVVCPVPVREVNPTELMQLYTALGGREPQIAATKEAPVDAEKSDHEIVHIAGTIAENRDKFNSLWCGHLEGHKYDHSAADQALMNILAFYTRDVGQLKRIFRQSKLGQRVKARREDYLDRTIRKAMDNHVEPKRFVYAGSAEKPPGETTEPAAVDTSYPDEKATQDITPMVAYPPGLVGDIAEFIFDQAPRPCQPIAIAGALALVSALSARAYSISKTGLNLYLAIVADTGRGKEAAESGINMLLRAVGANIPEVDKFMGPGDFGSGQGLLRAMNNQPCFMSIIREMGVWLNGVYKPRLNDTQEKLKGLILNLYSASGVYDQLNPTAYSDSTKNTQLIRSPCFTMLGQSTGHEFFKVVDESTIASGLIPRLLVVEYVGPQAYLKEPNEESDKPEKELVESLIALTARSVFVNQPANQNQRQRVYMDDDTINIDKQYTTYCTDKVNEGGIFGELFNRAHLNVLRVAAVIAVGVNHLQPLITREIYMWAVKFVERSLNSVTARFDAGDVGSPVNVTKQQADIKACIDKFFSSKLDGTEKTMRVNARARLDGYIPLHYLNSNLARKNSFSQDKIPRKAIQSAIDTLKAEGYMQEQTFITESNIKAVIYFVPSGVRHAK